MNTLARALIWIATLIAAADCNVAAVGAPTARQTFRASERPQQSPDHDSSCQLDQQNSAPCAMTDGRRVRQSRGRFGCSLDDWFLAALDCVRWLGHALRSA